VGHSERWDDQVCAKTHSRPRSRRISLGRALVFTSHHSPFSDPYDQNRKEEWISGRKVHADLVKSKSRRYN
jgi:hypothetical protein